MYINNFVIFAPYIARESYVNMLQNSQNILKITAEMFGGLGYFDSKQALFNKGAGARERRPEENKY